jgi:membrane protein
MHRGNGMSRVLRGTWACVRESVDAWNRDNVPRLAASLAFYTLLSLAPLVVIMVGVAARAFGRQAVAGQLAYQLQNYVGPEGAWAVEAILSAAYRPGSGVAATTFGVMVLLFGASSVVVELQDALNTIWQVPGREESTGSAIFRMIGQRFFAFILVLGAGAILTVSLLLSSGIAAMGKFSSGRELPSGVLQTAAFVTSFVVTALLFGAIYKLLPEVRLRWRDVAIGAAVTALVFCIGKEAIALYVGKTILGSTYGAAGSLALFLIWVYYSAQLFFLGAEFTKVYVKRLGRDPQSVGESSVQTGAV